MKATLQEYLKAPDKYCEICHKKLTPKDYFRICAKDRPAYFKGCNDGAKRILEDIQARINYLLKDIAC